MPIEFDNQDHCRDLIRLNEQWIKEHFELEEADRQLAADPFKLVRDGGHLLSLVQDGKVLGVCALLRESERRYQLARLAVEPSERGKGYGNLLIRAAIERARDDGAERLYLLTNTSLEPALALYRKHGFAVLSQGQHPIYARCNLVMELQLSPANGWDDRA